ncbi:MULTISPECIES: hypothetical protein [Nostoc]|uniref:Uncharacterized protein n=2 Tax=Nostoc TaxID=1177 RepID=A0ABR8IGA7_9NOSO|nr:MULTISPECIES: hypothetical protein [Nostoc]MBD2564815.1 hypothetical protein [Nostoc linckia FACHB-391]MBD2650527.1 hypothetical protein [Nostoc foliaceum FACHB-393]MBG1241876.1 hypothetical protein [Nostoc sp. NZL]
MNKVNTVKQDYEEQLMRLPNVTGVGIGDKDGRTVIKVFVTQKIPESDLQPQEVVPKSIEGCETDVEEIGIVTAQI